MIFAFGLVLFAAVAATWWLIRSRGGTPDTYPIPGTGERIVVEVLNGTRVDGLAREMTRRLRRAGIDVVYFGSARESDLDSTRILARRGDSTAAVRVRQVLGAGIVVSEPNPLLLLDVSVILGQDLALLLDLAS